MKILSIPIFTLVSTLIIFVMMPSWNVFGQVDIPLEEVQNSFGNENLGDTDASDLGTEQITFKAYLKPHENKFLADDGYYEIKKFGFIATNGSKICPSNQCKYGVEDGEFRPNSYSGGYILDGRLKVITEEGDTKRTKFYNFYIDLDKVSEEETPGKTIQTLEGNLAFGSNKFDPDFEYDVSNGTLLVDKKNPLLTILGER